MFILFILDFRKLCLKGKFANFVTLNNLERWQQSFGANYNGAAHFWLSSTTSTEIIFGDGDDNNDADYYNYHYNDQHRAHLGWMFEPEDSATEEREKPSEAGFYAIILNKVIDEVKKSS